MRSELIARVESATISPFRDFTPALGWRWRSNGGELHAPAEMATRHLFHTLRMIWNNVMPEEARVGFVKLYWFGPQYTPRYLREATLHIGRELLGRPDLQPEWRAQLDRMADWLRGADWAEAGLITPPLRALPHPQDPSQ